MQQISAKELADWLAAASRGERPAPVVLDVREPWELEICRIGGSVPMPMASVPPRCAELDPAAETVVVCHHGGRSFQVGMFLERQGFGAIHNLAGGVHAWSCDVDPAMPKY